MSIKSPLNRQFGTQFDSVFDVVKSNPMYDKTGGKIPSLDLNFAKSKSLRDSRSTKNLINFTRASSGTYVGSDGLIKTSPVNLFPYSEQFDQSTWTKANGAQVTPDAAEDPAGGNTADLINFTGGSQQVYFGFKPPAGTYTMTVYLRVASGSKNLRMQSYSPTDGVQNKAITVTDTWQRFSHTVVVSNVQTTFLPCSPVDLGEVYFWGAQLEIGSTASTYIPTTSTISGAPRFDHDPVTGESLGLLIEESRTNKMLNSGTTAEMVATSQTTRTSGGFAAPDGSTDASRVDLPAVTGANIVEIITEQLGSLPANTNHTASIYLKGVNGGELVYLTLESVVPTSFVAANLTTEWQRFDITGLSSGSGLLFFNVGVDTRSGTGQTNQPAQSFFAWAAQVEEGSFPTSYIPTSGTTVTRAADVATIEGNKFAKTNLLEYSERFDQSAWSKSGTVSVVPNSALSPDGLMTADQITLGTQNARIGQFDLITTTGQTGTASVYLKNIDHVGALTLRTGLSGGVAYNLNLSLTNEWVRYELTTTHNGTQNVEFHLRETDANPSGSFLIWGAQLEEGDELTKYTPSVESFVSRASTATYVDDATGLITTAAIDAARYENGELLLEEARTNLFTNSLNVAFSNSAASNSWLVGISAPDGSNDARKCTTNNRAFIDYSAFGNANVLATYSVYLRADSTLIRTLKAMRRGSGTSLASKSITITEQWQRFDVSFTSTTDGVRIEIIGGILGIEAWGCQLEPGSFPTSYIPTTSSAVTRAADVSTSALGVDSWYNTDESTVYFEGNVIAGASGQYPLWSIQGGVDRINGIQMARRSQSGSRFNHYDSGSVLDIDLNGPLWIDNSYRKLSAAIGQSSAGFADSGSLLGTDNSYQLPSASDGLDSLYLGSAYGGGLAAYNVHIKRFAYFPTRLPDDKLKSITA